MKPPVWAGVALVLISFDSTIALGASGDITEAEAVRMFLAESPQSRMVLLRAEAAGAEMSIGTEAPNPEVVWQVEDAAGVRDAFLTFQQALPVTGLRAIRRERAAAASAATGLLAERDLRDAAHALRSAFHDVRYRDSVAGVLRRKEGELTRIVALLRVREQEGEGSGYDVLRAEQELDALRTELGRAEAAGMAARARFGSFFDGASAMASAALAGDSASAESSWTVEQAVAMALAERADLGALREAARNQELDVQAARRKRIPEPVLGAGWKRVEAPGESDTGFVASLMVPLPIFDPGRFTVARARAVSGQIDLRREILEREIRAEVASAIAMENAARQAAERYADVERRSGEIRRIAQLAWDEGEMGVHSLLDALEASFRMELQALAARHEAKRERIELDRVMGREVRPW